MVGIDQSKKNIITAKENENEKLIFFQQEMTKDINMQFNAIFNFLQVLAMLIINTIITLLKIFLKT